MVHVAAGHTLEVRLTQPVSRHVLTGMASLGGVVRRHHQELGAIPGTLVGQLTAKLASRHRQQGAV